MMANDQGFYHYLPVDEQAMRWGIYLTGAGRGTVAPGQPYPPAAHPQLYDFNWHRGRTLPEFQLVLVSGGSGEFESKTTGLQNFDDAVLFFLTPGVWHRYHPNPDTGWSERWISFNGDLAHRLCNSQLLPRVGLLVHIGPCDDFIARFDALLSQIHANPVQNSILLSFRGLRLIGDAIEIAANKSPQIQLTASKMPATSDPIVDQALEIIWTRSHSAMSVPDIAHQLEVTRRTLDRRFAAATGHSVLHEINTCRLSRAQRLLVDTELPIKTVAFLAGFTTREQMRIAFQDSEGKSPKEYRQSNAPRNSEST